MWHCSLSQEAKVESLANRVWSRPPISRGILLEFEMMRFLRWSCQSRSKVTRNLIERHCRQRQFCHKGFLGGSRQANTEKVKTVYELASKHDAHVFGTFAWSTSTVIYSRYHGHVWHSVHCTLSDLSLLGHSTSNRLVFLVDRALNAVKAVSSAVFDANSPTRSCRNHAKCCATSFRICELEFWMPERSPTWSEVFVKPDPKPIRRKAGPAPFAILNELSHAC